MAKIEAHDNGVLTTASTNRQNLVAGASGSNVLAWVEALKLRVARMAHCEIEPPWPTRNSFQHRRFATKVS